MTEAPTGVVADDVLPSGRVRRRAARHRQLPTAPAELIDFLVSERYPARGGDEPVRVPGQPRRRARPGVRAVRHRPDRPAHARPGEIDAQSRRRGSTAGRRSSRRDRRARTACRAGSSSSWPSPPTVFLCVFYVWPFVDAARPTACGSTNHRDARGPIRRGRSCGSPSGRRWSSTVATLAIGLFPAWAISRFTFPGRRLLSGALTAVFVLPTVVVGAAFVALLPDSLDRSVWAIIGAHVVFNLAVVVRTVGASWSQLPDDLDHAAATLGAGPWPTFRHVTLPLIRPAVVAAAAIVFLFTFTSFGVDQGARRCRHGRRSRSRCGVRPRNSVTSVGRRRWPCCSCASWGWRSGGRRDRSAGTRTSSSARRIPRCGARVGRQRWLVAASAGGAARR